MSDKRQSPYYNSEAEKQELLKAISEFECDKPREVAKYVTLISGEENTGKTHLACTMADKGPVYLVDTEYRADIVVNKFLTKGANIKFKVVKSWRDMVVAVKYFIKKEKEPGTIVIDSGSDIQIFAEIQHLEETKRDKIYPQTVWAQIWAMGNALYDDIKASQHGLVITTRVKDEYLGDKTTGRKIPRIYDALKYKADFGIQFGKDNKPGFLYKNGENKDRLDIPIPRNMPLYDILPYIITESRKG